MKKGHIYTITNNINKSIYVGSTIQVNPKKRYYRHKHISKNCSRYGCLFDDDTTFKIVCSVDITDNEDLRKLEQVFIDMYSKSYTLVNSNWSFVPDHLKKQRRTGYCKKYNNTDKGKINRKWQNYRYQCRNKINAEIKKSIKVLE